jgi:glycosyltransferase involved in cell wall biosynthesis
MTPARTLVVIHVEAVSGPQRSLAPRLERLRETGTELHFLVPAEGPASSWAAELGSVETGIPGALMLPTGPFPAARAIGGMREQRRRAEAAARATGSELAIVSSPTMLGALRGARGAGAATLLYCGEVLARGGLRGVGGGAVARVAARHADAIVAASGIVARPYERRGAPVSVIHPPVERPPGADDLARRGAAWRAGLGLAPDTKVIAALGAITAGRGHDVLVRAASEADWQLVIGGATYDRPRDRAYAAELARLIEKLGLAERVHLPGPVEDPWALYAGADVFVNPARMPEGFGRAVCEALAARRPVVATRVGGVSEALRDGDTALLVEPESAPALGDAIGRLLADGDLAARLAAAGAEDVGRRLNPAAGRPAFDSAVTRALAGRS